VAGLEYPTWLQASVPVQQAASRPLEQPRCTDVALSIRERI
jgi:hypothetical protein